MKWDYFTYISQPDWFIELLKAKINADNDYQSKLAKIQELVSEDLELVNQVIIERLASDIDLINQLSQHIIQSGGKRLRPIVASVR